jgi:hypothetical protein
MSELEIRQALQGPGLNTYLRNILKTQLKELEEENDRIRKSEARFTERARLKYKKMHAQHNAGTPPMSMPDGRGWKHIVTNTAGVGGIVVAGQKALDIIELFEKYKNSTVGDIFRYLWKLGFTDSQEVYAGAALAIVFVLMFAFKFVKGYGHGYR